MNQAMGPKGLASGVFESIFDHGIDGIFLATEDGRVLRANRRACELLGWSEEDLVERGDSVLVDRRDCRWSDAAESRRRNGAFRGVLRFMRGDGSAFSAEVSSAVLPGGEGIYVSFRDLTAEEAEAARTAETRRAAAEVIDSLESISDMYVGVDADWRVTYINAQAEARLGVDRADVLGGDLWERFPPLVGSVFEPFYRGVMGSGEPATLEDFYGGADLWTEVRAYPLRRGGIGIYFRDIAERRAMEAERERLLVAERDSRQAAERARSDAAYRATHDELTGLLNRAGLVQRVDACLASRPASTMTVLMIDLDRFKLVNDSLGHRTGDDLLTVFAERLAGLAGPADVVARLGGDEFVVAMFGVSKPEADKTARAVIAAGRRPVEVKTSLLVTASVGLAGTGRPGGAGTGRGGGAGTGREGGAGTPADLDVALREADAAMYRAKEAGRDRAVWFDEQMHLQAVRRMQIEHDLRHALERDELFVEYQPAFGLRCGRVDHVEALVRWRHRTRGLIPPLEFIPVAEECGLIHRVGEWVLAGALDQAARWAHIRDLRVWINVSPHQLAVGGLPDLIATHLERVGLPGYRIGIEVTESALADRENLTTVLQDIRRLGVAVAIDDFGTGYSSLSRLSTSPVNVIKIDQSFVADADTAHGKAILASIVALGHAIGAHVIAEGVETEAQLVAVSSLGVDSASGYLLGRPTPPDHLTLPAAHIPATHLPATDLPAADDAAPDTVLACTRPQPDPQRPWRELAAPDRQNEPR